jgi:SAM-dependent methyltransferase
VKRCLACGARFEAAAWRCPQCGAEPEAIGGFPAFAPALARGGAGYDPEHFDRLFALEAGHFWFRARNRLIQWALARHFPGARSFCEIGCGTGYVLSGVREALPGAVLSASEAYAEGLPFAARRVPGARLMQMDARAIPFEEEFDAIGAFDVIEHIADDRAALRSMHRALAPGGGLLLTVPQHPWLWSWMDEEAHHVRRYTAPELRTKVEEAGFRVQRMSSFVSLLLPAMMLSRLGRRKAAVEADPYSEFRMSPGVNHVLEWVLGLERGMIRAGVSFPAGGSLLLVARKR